LASPHPFGDPREFLRSRTGCHSQIEQISGRDLTGSAEPGWARAKYSHRLAARPYALERFRAKWIPVRVKKTRQNNNLELRSDSIRTDYALVFSNRATTRGDNANFAGSFGLGSFTTYQRPGTLLPGIVGEKVPPEDFAARSIVEVQIPKGILLPDGIVSSGSSAASGIIVSMRVLHHRDVKAKRLHRKCFHKVVFKTASKLSRVSHCPTFYCRSNRFFESCFCGFGLHRQDMFASGLCIVEVVVADDKDDWFTGVRRCGPAAESCNDASKCDVTCHSRPRVMGIVRKN